VLIAQNVLTIARERWMNRALTVMIASTGMARQDGRCGGTSALSTR